MTECPHGEPRGQAACAICRRMNLNESTRLKQEALEHVEDGADNLWIGTAMRMVKYIADTTFEFTADDVLAQMKATRYETPDNRAMGAVMLKAQHKGWIRPTERFIKSTNPLKHQSPTRVWQSCLCNSHLFNQSAS